MTDSDRNPNGEKSCECCDATIDPAGIDPDPAGINIDETNTGATDRRWLGEGDPTTAQLPADLRAALGVLLGEAPVDTLGEWAGKIRRRTGGGAIDTADLCIADSETPHRATLDGETYHFLCFYDAVALAALHDSTVDIRTESPEGTGIEARAVGTEELRVSPGRAVFSFGVDRSVDSPTGDSPTHADIYTAVCPYVKAFPDRAAYERWAGSIGAATVAAPLAGATDLARVLI